MTSDPNPLDSLNGVDAKSPILLTDAHGSDFLDPFQLQRWVAGIRFQQRVALVSKFPNLSRKLPVLFPEMR